MQLIAAKKEKYIQKKKNEISKKIISVYNYIYK